MAERTVLTKVTNAVHYSDGTIRIDNVRFSFPHIGTPMESNGDDGAKKLVYSVDAMLPKSTHGAAKDLVKKVIEALAKENGVTVGQSFWFLKDGDKLADEDEKKEPYRGHFLVKASEKRRPSARARDTSIVPEAKLDDEFYGGMWGSILIRPWYFNGKARNTKTYPKRILANLIGVQKVRDDEPFGEGRVNDDGVFSAVEGDDGFGEDQTGGL